MKKTTISIFTTTQGHASIAKTISEALSSRYIVFVNKHQGKEFDLYAPLHTYFPLLGFIPYKLSKQKPVQKLANSYAQFTYKKKILDQLEHQKPDLIISTWFILNPVFESLDKEKPYLNILTDPHSLIPLEPTPHAYNFVFDKVAARYCQQQKVPKNRIINSGWFVQNQFETPYNQTEIRHRLNLNPNLLTFLIIGGSEGTSALLKIIPYLSLTNKPLQVVIVCGHNKRIFTTINRLSKILNKKKNLHFIPIGYTDQLHQYMQSADLVIGKAGPNTIFESVATHTPFMAITHVTGHESGNLNLIKKYRIGYVEENPIKAAAVLNRIVDKPHELNKFQPHLKKLAIYNRKSKQVLINFLKNHLGT